MDDQLYTSPSPTETIGSMDYSWAGLMGTIVLFLAILVVVLLVIRRLNGSAMASLNVPWAKVLDRQALSAQQTLYLVEVAGKLQVLAATDHHIEVIREIDDPDAVVEILDEIANRPPEQVQGLMLKWLTPLFGKSRKSKQDFSKELERLLEEVQK